MTNNFAYMIKTEKKKNTRFSLFLSISENAYNEIVISQSLKGRGGGKKIYLLFGILQD
jgi:hypothetical protein